MKNENKKIEKKAMAKKTLIELTNKTALNTSKEYINTVNASLNVSFNENAISVFLDSILPKNFVYSIAQNTTGKGFTRKIKNQYGEQTDRFFFPSEKVKYQGFGFGIPQLKKMIENGFNEGELCQVRQGKKNYFYNDDMTLLSE